MTTVISVEYLSKTYRLGQIGTGTFANDLNVWWAKLRGKPNPLLRIGETERLPSPNGRGAGGEVEELWALRDVNFTVQQGEVLGIIGKNGAGKSTLLKILSRVTAPTSGKVKVKGRIASLLEVGTGFHPELTGRENIYLNGAILGMKRDEITRKFDEIVDFAEVEKFIDTPVKRYSSGMYVRLAFAVAAHLEPEILVVDEVLAVGDAEFQKKCLGKIGEVAQEGRTVLFVSHNMVAIEGLCSRIILLRTGNIDFDGETKEGIRQYLLNVTNQTEGVPLENREDRDGNGKVRAVDIRILDEQGHETNAVDMCKPFSILIRTKGALNKAIIGVLIGNAFRKQLLRGYTWEQSNEEINLGGDDWIECSFEDEPLMHGNYDISIWIGRPNDVWDYIESAATLTVNPVDIYGTGRLPDPRGGIVVSKVNWKINGKSLS